MDRPVSSKVITYYLERQCFCSEVTQIMVKASQVVQFKDSGQEIVLSLQGWRIGTRERPGEEHPLVGENKIFEI